MSESKAKRWVKWHLLNPCLAAILTFLLTYDHPPYVENDRNNRNPTSNSQNANQSGSDYQSVTFGWRLRQAFDALTDQNVQTPQSDPECDEECQRDNQDLEAQRDMALWAQAMFWTNILIVIVTGFGVYYVARTLGATITAANATLKGAQATLVANDIQQEMIKAGQWVHIDISPIATPSAPLAWDGGKLSLRFKIGLENVGVGPAINVAVRARDVNEMLGDDSAKSIEELKDMCRAVSGPLGQSVKPNEMKEFPIVVEIGRERAEVILNGRGEFPQLGIIFIMCCVYYQTPYAEEGVFKRFALTAMKSANNAFGAPITMEDIPLGIDGIVIRRTFSDGPNVLGINEQTAG